MLVQYAEFLQIFFQQVTLILYKFVMLVQYAEFLQIFFQQVTLILLQYAERML